MKNLLMLLSFLIPFTFAFSDSESAPDNQCPAPANVQPTKVLTTSVTYDWDDCWCTGAVYKMYYEHNGTTSALFSSSASTFTFSGLAAGGYTFFFYTECVGASESIIIEEVVIL